MTKLPVRSVGAKRHLSWEMMAKVAESNRAITSFSSSVSHVSEDVRPVSELPLVFILHNSSDLVTIHGSASLSTMVLCDSSALSI